jgi:hypothetical protein
VREGARSKVRSVEEKGLSKEEKGGAGAREMAESEEELGWRVRRSKESKRESEGAAKEELGKCEEERGL